MPLLSKTTILAANDLQTEDVEVPDPHLVFYVERPEHIVRIPDHRDRESRTNVTDNSV